jgi:membrane-associated protein
MDSIQLLLDYLLHLDRYLGQIIDTMSYFMFTAYNVIGACIWVGLLVPVGRLFGNLPIVKEYFSLVVLAIIFISILPLAFEFWKQFRKKQRSLAPAS